MRRLGNFYPPEGPEFASTPEIRVLAADNAERRRLKFLEDVSIFRAAVFGKLISCDVISPDGYGWAVFDCEGDDPEGALSVVTRNEMAVVVVRRTVDQVPIIHVMGNEVIDTPTGHAYLTTHFVLDHEGDTQYFMDIFDPNDVAGSKHASLFCVDAEARTLSVLGQFNYSFCTTMDIDGNIPTDHTSLMPLGIYLNLEDKVHSLEVGFGMLNQIKDLEPAVKGY